MTRVRRIAAFAGAALLAVAPARAQNTPASTPPPAVGSSQSPNTPAAPRPGPERRGGDPLGLLLAALVATVVSGGVAFAVTRIGRGKAAPPPAEEAPGPQWSGFPEFRSDVLSILKEVGKAGNLDTTPRLKISDWVKGLARARAQLERAPLTRADCEPLRQLWVEVNKSSPPRGSTNADDLTGSLLSFTQALSRRAQDATREDGGASGASARSDLHRLEEQWERGQAGLTEQLKHLSARLQKVEERPEPSLGQLVEAEFRELCETRAAELEQRLSGSRGPAGAPAPPPPAVAAALRVADAALKVSEEALKARALDPGVKAQLTNLATLAGTLQAMCPVSSDRKPPSVEAIRQLPQRPEARWQPEMVARGGSVINAVTAYWSEVSRLLQAEAARIETWVDGLSHDPGIAEAAIGDWLASRLLPLLDQAGSAIDSGGPARREAREGGASGLLAALDDLHRACDSVLQGTGLEFRTARKGEVQHPAAGIKIEHADGGERPDTVLEVRHGGWSWNGRLLRELHVVVQEEAAGGGAETVPPRADEGPSRIRRL